MERALLVVMAVLELHHLLQALPFNEQAVEAVELMSVERLERLLVGVVLEVLEVRTTPALLVPQTQVAVEVVLGIVQTGLTAATAVQAS
jgi:hypothetical protein